MKRILVLCLTVFCYRIVTSEFCAGDSDCKNGALCKINGMAALKSCECKNGTEGPFCEDISNCKTLQCGKDDDCVYNDEKSEGECKCEDTFLSYDSEDNSCKSTCESNSDCNNRGSCVKNGSLKTCYCKGGTEGPYCETITKCKNLMCGNDARCVYNDDKEEGECLCKETEMTFDPLDRTCKSICESNSDCKNRGSCVKDGSLKTCNCKGGTEGPYCETITTCKNLMCGNDAKCVYNDDKEEGECQCKKTELTFDPVDQTCKITDEKCFTQWPKCETTGGLCSFNEEKNVIECKCPDSFVYIEMAGCSGTCETNSDCNNRGSCMTNGSAKTCNCKGGTEGSYCEIITMCKNLMCGNHANCVYNNEKEEGECQCKNTEMTFDPIDKTCKITKEKCFDQWPKCEATGGLCSFNEEKNAIECKCPDNFIYKEIAGCSVSEEFCNDRKPNCTDTGGSCKFDENNEVYCECWDNITYEHNHGCRVPTDMCIVKKPKCKESGGICKFLTVAHIQCLCPEGTRYNYLDGCEVFEGFCNKKKPNCIDTGGSCISTEYNGIICECWNDIEYDENIGCKVPEERCNQIIPICKKTGGTCYFDVNNNYTIECKCPEKFEYDKVKGCFGSDECECPKEEQKCTVYIGGLIGSSAIQTVIIIILFFKKFKKTPRKKDNETATHRQINLSEGRSHTERKENDYVEINLHSNYRRSPPRNIETLGYNKMSGDVNIPRAQLSRSTNVNQQRRDRSPKYELSREFGPSHSRGGEKAHNVMRYINKAYDIGE